MRIVCSLKIVLWLIPHLLGKESLLPHQIPDRVAGRRHVILAPISHLVLPLLLVWLTHGLLRVHGLFLVRNPLHSIPDGCLSFFPAVNGFFFVLFCGYFPNCVFFFGSISHLFSLNCLSAPYLG